MKRHLIRESYSKYALAALLINLRGRYPKWTFELQPKSETQTYHQVYGSSELGKTDFEKVWRDNELETMTDFANVWVSGYEWGYQEGEEK